MARSMTCRCRREFGITGLQVCKLALIRHLVFRPSDCLVDAGRQAPVIDGLLDELESSRFNRRHGHVDVTMSRDHDDGEQAGSFRKRLLQRQAADAGHSHVGHHTIEFCSRIEDIQERLGGSKAADREAPAAKIMLNRVKYGLVIVNQCSAGPLSHDQGPPGWEAER